MKKKVHMKKTVQYGAVFFLCLVILTGCGMAKTPENMDASSIAISKNGAVTSWLVDVFDKEYYDIAALENMAVQEAAAYNTKYQTGVKPPVTVEKVETYADGSDKVAVVFSYDNAATFTSYNGGVLFYGTVSQAKEQGYDLNVELTDVKSGEALAKVQLSAEGEKHILITDQKVRLYSPGRVTHISGGAVLLDDGSVDASEASDTVYILMR